MELDLSRYNNFLDFTNLTVKDILNDIQSFKLNFIPVRNATVEWGLKLAPFIKYFYGLIYHKKSS